MKSLKLIVSVFFMFVVFTNTSFAQANENINDEPDFTVKYTGVEGNYLCFLVEIKEKDATYKSLKINDKTEGELYADYWGKDNVTQKFKIEKLEAQVLIFNVQVGKKEYSKTYSFSKNFKEKFIVKEGDLVIF
jgi:hypothetical protein